MEEIKHLQMSIVRLDTNADILENIVENDEKKYPHGLIFINKD